MRDYTPRVDQPVDVCVIGCGAAGLMSAIFAGRAAREAGRGMSIAALDGARTLGAKILVAGGGRCNVTHHEVTEAAYAGSSRNAIKKVLRRFDVPRTIEFFAELGVELKREETGKLFPVTDRARTVLDALLREAERNGVQLEHPWRVGRVERVDGVFRVIEAAPGERTILARRVILATGGKSLPKSGSDGAGYETARSLGHSITDRVFPALVPLVLPGDHFLRGLNGVTVPTTLEVRSATGKRLASFTNSTLFTHFGLSGPGPLDISRYFTDARLDDPGARLVMNAVPSLGESCAAAGEALDRALQSLGRGTIITLLRELMPERLARALCDEAKIDGATTGANLPREARRALVRAVTELELPIAGDRGYTYAEVTAGGVPLAELHLERMESRACPGLFLAGEVCDVDGRIGGFNFQWAWASGFVAGSSAASG